MNSTKAIARNEFDVRDSPTIMTQPLFVLPSLTEGLGVVGIEATAFIGTNVRANYDQFKVGILIPPTDLDSIAYAVLRTF
jgi:hypothetical protein